MARKKENKSAKIRALLDKGMLQRDIAKKLKVSAQLVYIVARNHGALSDRQNMLAKRLGINPKKYKFKQEEPVKRMDDRAVLDKLWSILNEYRKAA